MAPLSPPINSENVSPSRRYGTPQWRHIPISIRAIGAPESRSHGMAPSCSLSHKPPPCPPHKPPKGSNRPTSTNSSQAPPPYLSISRQPHPHPTLNLRHIISLTPTPRTPGQPPTLSHPPHSTSHLVSFISPPRHKSQELYSTSSLLLLIHEFTFFVYLISTRTVVGKRKRTSHRRRRRKIKILKTRKSDQGWKTR